MSRQHPPPPSWDDPRRWLWEIVACLAYTINLTCFLSTAIISSNLYGAKTLGQYLGLGALMQPIDGSNTIHPSHHIAESECSWSSSLLINTFAMLIFILQHSIMGRMKVQEKSSQLMGKFGERMSHLLASCVALRILMGMWTAIPYELWNFPSRLSTSSNWPTGAGAAVLCLVGTCLDILQLLSWFYLFASFWTICRHDLFCYRQACVDNLELPTVVKMKSPPLVYRVVRQPLFAALLAIMWFNRRLTAGHLVWNIYWSIYTLIGCIMQERNLLNLDQKEGKREWREYMTSTPRLVPYPFSRRTTEEQCDAILEGGFMAWLQTTSMAGLLESQSFHSNKIEKSHVVEIFLPLARAGTKSHRNSLFKATQSELIKEFGGLTAFSRSPAEGFWQPENASRPEQDDVIQVEVITPRLNPDWWRSYAKTLAHRFQQQEILIRSYEVSKLGN